ncbi:MAG: hydroxyacylglutathione hydrolase [Nannocystaceae bacterium]|nr:hydroxyacylglutathione hydrolase [bacterium]
MPELLQIPVWRDNYVYLAIHEGRAFVVDPSDAEPVLAALQTLPGVALEAVVNTHHHPDHVGGNLKLVEATGCAVVGAAHDRERIPGITRAVDIGARIEVAGLAMDVLDVRAHTRGHVAYRTEATFDRVIRHGHDGVATRAQRLEDRPALFVGDSLFLGGCGRLFEGSAADLHASMQVLSEQRPESLVCCAHEYTASNLRFAADVLPSHPSIRARLDGLERERGASRSSVPDTLERELETNPFLLALDPEHRGSIAASLDVPPGDIVAVVGALRSAKDRF